MRVPALNYEIFAVRFAHLKACCSRSKEMTTYTAKLRKCVKAKFGPWLLVQLPSGRWSTIWYLFIDDMEPHAKMIFEEVDWFYTKPEERGQKWRDTPSFAKRSDALDCLQMRIEDTRLSDGPSHYSYYRSLIKEVRTARRRSLTKEAALGCPRPQERELKTQPYRDIRD
jgi:hypothetical protein